MAFENLFVRTKRTIGSIQLDSILVEDHKGSVTITKNPVEAGADITDHAIVQPDVLTIKGTVTDTPLGTAAFGQLLDSITKLFGTSTSDNLTRSQQAYESLRMLKNNAEPIDVITGLRIYSNMMITDLSTKQDKDSSRILIFDMTLEEVILTESRSIDVSEADLSTDISKSASSTVNKGKQELKQVSGTASSSILKTVTSWFGG